MADFDAGDVTLRDMALSPDARLLAAGYQSKDKHGILVWDVATRKVKQPLAPDLGHVFAVGFSPDGRFLACAGMWGMTVYETLGFQQHLSVRGDISQSVAFSFHRDLLAIPSSEAGIVRVWDPLVNQEIVVLPHPGRPHSVAFSKSGKVFVLADEGSVCIRKLPSTEEKLVLPGHTGNVTRLAFSPEGGLLASAGHDRRVIIWNPATGQAVKELTGFRNQVQSVAFSPRGRLLAAGAWDGAIRIWDAHSWEEWPLLEQQLGPVIWAVAFSPNGQYFAACGQEGLTIWRVVERGRNATPKLESIRSLPDTNITSFCFSPESTLLAFVRRSQESRGGHTLHVWDLLNSRERPLRTPRLLNYVNAMTFDPKGDHLVFINEQEEVEVWNVVTEERTHSFGRSAIGQDAECLTSSVDGAWIAIGGKEGVTVWDMEARKLLLALPVEHSAILRLAWSPNREQLAVGTAHGEIAIWNIPKVRAQLGELGLDW
jgi:WD40 repeat protein